MVARVYRRIPPLPSIRGGTVPVVLTILVITQLLFGIDATVITVALPSIGAELGLDVVAQSWVQTGYVVAFGGLLLLGGRIGDALGRRRALVIGVVVFAMASLAGGLAPSGAWLVVCRVLQGAGAALASPNTMALLMLTFPAGPARNRALAIFSAVLGTGAAVGLVVGGLLTSTASWRWGLLVNPPIAAVVVFLAPRVLPESDRLRRRLDLPAIVTSAVGLAALVFGLTRAASDGWGSPVALGVLVAAVVLLTTFVLVERRSPTPVLPLELVLDRTRGAGYLAALSAAAAMFGAFFLLTQFMQQVLGFGALGAGLGFLPLMGTQVLTARLVPRLLARVRPSTLVVSGALLVLVAVLWLARLDGESTWAGGLLGPMLLLGLGGGMTFVPLSSVILGGVRPEQAGAAAAALQVSQYTGSALGVAVVVGVFATATRTGADLPAALATGMLGAAGCTLLVALLAFAVAGAGEPARR
jgi:EmrB/QacA subfamily drug resistance transporter